MFWIFYLGEDNPSKIQSLDTSYGYLIDQEHIIGVEPKVLVSLLSYDSDLESTVDEMLKKTQQMIAYYKEIKKNV